MKTQCEFCGRIRECEPSSIVGYYCKDCHILVIAESREAIKTINNRKPKSKPLKGK